MLKLNDISVGFGAALISNVTAQINMGELVVLIGPNGAGKSCLIHSIINQIPLLKGKIEFNDFPLHLASDIERAKILSIVLSSSPNFGKIKVTEIVSLGRSPYTNYWGKLTKTDHELIDHSISLVKGDSLREKFWFQLSDGEKQKILLAKALCQETPLLILDEPASHLDPINKLEFLSLLKDICAKHGKGILFSSHDLDFSLKIAKSIWIINSHHEFKSVDFSTLAKQDLINSTFPHSCYYFDYEKTQFVIKD
jgi:iron complex transport system ATP-binding protein